MSRRTLLLGGASGLAAAILLLSLLAGSPEPAQTSTGNVAERVGEIRLPTLGNSQRIERPDQMPNIKATGEGGQLTFKDGGRTTVLHYDRLEPQPLGVFEVEQPAAQVLFSDRLVMTIDSDSATIVAPNNDLRRGTFRDKVVLSLFETEPGIPVDTSRDDQLVLRVFLEETNFDVELGSVESPGEIHLTGPQFDFLGTGLSIGFNELHRRMDKLEVIRARSIRFRPDDRQEPPDLLDDRAELATTDVEDRPVQYYRARFEDQVQVRGADGRLKIDADYLEVIFSLTAASMPSARGAPPGASGQSPGRGDSPAKNAGAQQPLFVPDDAQDVNIALDGRLIVEPEQAPPADMTIANDVLVRLASRPDSGRQVSIETPDGETVVAPEADYLVSAARVRASGTQDRPVILRSPRLGTIRGAQMCIDQARGTGYVMGPGHIDARTVLMPSDQVQDTDEEPIKSIDQNLQLTWTDRLDLRFYVDPNAPSDFGPQNRITALQSAAFRGGVKAHESRFDLDAAELVVELTEPDANQNGRQSIHQINAAGDVVLATRDDQRPNIHAQQLSIELSTDADGEIYPTRLLARKQVRTTTQGLDFAAGMLDVTFDEARPSAQRGAMLTESKLAIRQIVAEENVQVRVTDPAIELSAPRLRADVGSEQLELFGDGDHLASLQRDGDRISASHIVLSQTKQTMDIDGSGLLQVLVNPDQANETLSITWQETMHYDHIAGKARFNGDVMAQTQGGGGDEITRLTAPRLDLTFRGDPKPALDDANPDASLRRREIDTVSATGGVKFLAEAYAPLLGSNARRVLESRLTVEAPQMDFDRVTERIAIPQPGHMLIEDYRPELLEEASTPDRKTASFVGNDVNVSGRGATLFQWDGQLTLDARQNDMIIEDAVEMTHRPLSGDEVMQMDADRFVLDLHETGGLEQLLAGNQPQPQIKSIRADGHVVIMDGKRVIFTDHLQYTQTDSTVLLWSDPGRQIEARDDGEAIGQQAGSIRWNLDRNLLIVEDIEGGIVPIQPRAMSYEP